MIFGEGFQVGAVALVGNDDFSVKSRCRKVVIRPTGEIRDECSPAVRNFSVAGPFVSFHGSQPLPEKEKKREKKRHCDRYNSS